MRRPRPAQPADAAALYVGDVMHARLKPMGHRFSYRVMSLLIDLDRLADADRQSPLFGVNRAALYSFHEADHGRRDGSSLRAYAQHCAAERGIDLTGGRVLLLCYPRLFGYTFNPLSVYFCYRADGELALLIYEVRNTFGDIHPYVLPVTPGRNQRRRRAAAAGQAVLRLALHRDGDALPFSRPAAGRTRASCEFWKPTAKAPCSPQPSMAAVAHSTPRGCCARSSRSRWSPSRSWRRSTGRRCGSG